MTNWLKIFLPRKYAVIDGRRVTEPIINGSDTTFTVTGDSNWGSTSKYNVHLQGPNSYYLYKTLSEPKDDPSAGGARQEQITVTGNEPERLNRYRGYINSLAPEDYKYWWQQIVSKENGGKVKKGEDGTIISNHYIYDKPARKYDYDEPDYYQHITPEVDLDRSGTHPRYTAVPGTIHSTTMFKIPVLKPNFSGLMSPGETRLYIDPKTYRISTVTGPHDPHYRTGVYEYGDEHPDSILDRMQNNNGIYYLGEYHWGTPGYDVITWPDGNKKIIRKSPQQPSRGAYQIPSNPNDNTSTRGSIEWGNIKGGVYPGTEEKIPAPEGYNPADEWEEIHDQVNGKVIVTWRNKKTGRITKIKPFKTGGKVEKGYDGMVVSEENPWGQGEIRQGFQKARPDWMKKFDDWANKVSDDLNNPQKSGPLTWFAAPAFDYLTGRPGNIGHAVILPGAGPLNSAGKAAVGKSAKFEKQLAERVAQVALQRAKDLEISALRKKALSMTDAELDKAIENAFQERGLREAMKKWDQELLTNADRNIINPSWLEEFKLNNIKELDPKLLQDLTKGSEESLLGWLGITGTGAAAAAFGASEAYKNSKKNKVQTKQKTKNSSKNLAAKVQKGEAGMATNISQPMNFNITKRESPVLLTSGYTQPFQVVPGTEKMEETTEYFNSDGTIKIPQQTIKTGRAWYNPETMETWSPSGYGYIKAVNTRSFNFPKQRRRYFNTGGKISDLLNNQEFLVNLEKCGGKIKKACGGKMKKKK